MIQTIESMLEKKLLVFTWETLKDEKHNFCIGKSVEGDYTIGVEEVMDKWWTWNVNRGNEWLMDSSNYPKGNCENQQDAIRMAREFASTHYENNKKKNR